MNTTLCPSPFKGDDDILFVNRADGRGMGFFSTSTEPHPHPNPPLEGEGATAGAQSINAHQALRHSATTSMSPVGSSGVVLVCAAHVVLACKASDVLQAELAHG
jgi:hypothetical protein